MGTSPLTSSRKRNRLAYLALCLGLFGLGLASRHFDNPISAVFGKYPGDTMWAMLLYCGLGLIWSRAPVASLASLAVLLSLVVEGLKFYQAPWMVALRASMVGSLVLGHVFSVENLLAYAVGIAVCVACEWLWIARRWA